MDIKYYALEFDGYTIAQRIFITMGNLVFADNYNICVSLHKLSVSLYGEIINYKAVKGKTIIIFSIKAKLLAISYVAKVYICWLYLFENIEFYLNFKLTIYCNNLQII